MSESQKTTTQLKVLLRKRIYKKIQKKPVMTMLTMLRLLSLMVDASEALVVEYFAEEVGCRLCAEFLVKTIRKSCCGPCFTGWINDNDYDDEDIVCRVCNRDIKIVLSDSEFQELWEKLDLKKIKIRKNEHFSYPVLNQAAMDQLFEDISSKSIPN